MESQKPETSTIIGKERPTNAKNLSIDSEIWFILMHTYLKTIFDDPNQDQTLKNLNAENLALTLGK
jgi:hypothetical protein